MNISTEHKWYKNTLISADDIMDRYRLCKNTANNILRSHTPVKKVGRKRYFWSFDIKRSIERYDRYTQES